MKCLLRIFSRPFRWLKTIVDQATGLARVPAETQIQIELLQIDVRTRLGAMMSVVGELVLIALSYSLVNDNYHDAYYILFFIITFCYLSILLSSRIWISHKRRELVFRKFQKSYVIIQIILGGAWGGLIMTSLSFASSEQRGQILAILIGLVSTAVFSGPAIYSISFWTPLVILSFLAFCLGRHINLSTIVGLLSYFVLTFFAIFSLNRKLVDREIGLVELKAYKENSEILLREFDESGGDWLWQIDKNLHIIHPTPRFCIVAERPIHEMSKLFIEILECHSDSTDCIMKSEATHELKECFFDRKPFRDLTVPVFINDKKRWWDLSGRPIFNDAEGFLGFRGVARDVTEIQEIREKVNHVVMHDLVTSLQNRRSFTISIEDAFNERHDHNYYLLCLDLDYFKSINDRYGHLFGDKILSAVGQRLDGCIRHPSRAFRIGGDEFAVILLVESQMDVGVISERIIKILSAPYSIEKVCVSIGASIGIAPFLSGSISAEDIYHKADLALYRAKSEGRCIFRFYNSENETKFEETQLIEADLKLTTNNEQLYIVFQPIVHLSTGRHVGAEALLRWDHPSRGEIEPVVFIPMLERSGMISAIGLRTIGDIFKVASMIRNDSSIAINLSPLQLADGELPNKIENLMLENNIDSRRIHFEITESVLLEHPQRLAVLHRIRTLGFKISLDDFGTGFSSMRLLNEFPFDKIKIDGSFTRGDPNDRRLSSILETMIQLGRKLDITIVGEGIENQEQAIRLMNMGCTEGQGFFFHKPMSKENYLEFSCKSFAKNLFA